MTFVGQFVKGRKIAGGHWYSQSRYVKEYIRERDNYTCQLCGAEGWSVDHIIPWRVSHDSSVSNLRVLCHACNVKTSRPRGVKTHKTIPIEQYETYLRRELALAIDDTV